MTDIETYWTCWMKWNESTYGNGIDKLAEKDNFTNDKQYNHGLKLIRENGYIYVCTEPDVKYYCMCNGY